MIRILRTASVCLLLGAAACDGDPAGVGETPGGGGGGQSCTTKPPALGQLPPAGAPLGSSAATLPVLGQGAISDRYTSELWVHGNWAYTGTWGWRESLTGNALYIWNVSGNTPVLRDSVLVSDAATLGDVQVSDDGKLLVVATEGGQGSIVVYDLANPAKPVEIARHSNANTQSGVHTAEVARVNGKLYAFLSLTSIGSVAIVDLSDPRNPGEVWVGKTGSPFTHDVFVRDGLLFTAGWNGGTTVWDIGGAGCGSPEKPVQVTSFQTTGGKVHNIWWYHDPSGSKRYAFIGEEGPAQTGVSSSGDIHVVDLGDWSSPREVAFYTLAGAGTHNFSLDEQSGILYAAYYNGGVRALDVRGDLGACTAAQKDASGRCDLGKMGREAGRALVGGGQVSVWGVQLVGSTLYASDMLNGLWKIDVSSLKR